MLKGSLTNIFVALTLAASLGACAQYPDAPARLEKAVAEAPDYRIGPGDQLQVFVWRNTELSANVRVRPDGFISVPLIEDLRVADKTPTQAARAIEEKLSTFVKDAVVTVIMSDFIGPVNRQIRVAGEAAKPLSIPYRSGITLMDAMIQSGGLTQFAAGNRALLVRVVDGNAVTYRVYLDTLMKDGDISANVELAPGDILIIPQSLL